MIIIAAEEGTLRVCFGSLINDGASYCHSLIIAIVHYDNYFTSIFTDKLSAPTNYFHFFADFSILEKHHFISRISFSWVQNHLLQVRWLLVLVVLVAAWIYKRALCPNGSTFVTTATIKGLAGNTYSAKVSQYTFYTTVLSAITTTITQIYHHIL